MAVVKLLTHVFFTRQSFMFSLDAIARQNNAHIYDNYSYEYERLEPFTIDNPTATAETAADNLLDRSARFLTKWLNASTRGSRNSLSRSEPVRMGRMKSMKSQSVNISGRRI